MGGTARLSRYLAVTLIAAGCAGASVTETGQATTSDQPTTADTSSTTTSPTTSAIEWISVDNPVSMTGRTTVDSELRIERLPAFSDVAVRGQIVSLGPADYLVPAAVLDDVDGSRARLARETSAPISTPITVRVHDVVATRINPPVDVAPGDELTLWVSGGSVEFTVTPEDAARTGLRPDISHEEEQAVIDSGEEPPQGPGPVPTEPFQTGYSSPEFVSATEGDEAIAFLRWAEWYDPVANDGSYYDMSLLLSVDYTGVGLFVRDDHETADPNTPFAHAATGASVSGRDLLDAAGALSELTGSATAPQALGLDLYDSP